MHGIDRDNGGVSLIEVIVTLLISSLVLLAVTGFLSVSTKTYRNSSIETSLQMEAQVALNQMDDLLRKASSYLFADDISIEEVTYRVLGILAKEETGAGVIEYYYVVIHDPIHRQLRFRKVKKEEVTENDFRQFLVQLTEKELAGTPSLLANYVKSIRITPTQNAEQKLTTVSIELELEGKSFTSFSSVSLRNY